MKFINRYNETGKIKELLATRRNKMVIVYGRRRIGKTRLLQHVKKSNDIYYTADEREAPLQIASLAKLVASVIKGFDRVIYPDWESIISNLIERVPENTTIIIDEFPYLVKNAPELPSILQKIKDSPGGTPFHLIICGSSQKMMQNLVMDYTSPLYGRADHIIKVDPMSIYWLKEALKCTYTDAVEEYSIWGGVPRYWELRKQEPSLKEAVIHHIFDKHGILHEEPLRLFLDDSRDTVQMFSLIYIVAAGAHRLSEIASRVAKPATSLNRPLQKLIDLGYLKREIPFGHSKRTAKKTLYQIADPFIHFYFRYVLPEKSLLQMGYAGKIYKEVFLKSYHEYCSYTWENICREAVPALFGDKLFEPGQRWWGRDIENKEIEIDILSASRDKKELILGEAKWSSNINLQSCFNELIRKAETFPHTKGKIIRKVLFLKKKPHKAPDGIIFYTPKEVIDALK